MPNTSIPARSWTKLFGGKGEPQTPIMPGLDPGIHVLAANELVTWMAGNI